VTAYLLVLVALSKTVGKLWLAVLPWKVILEPTELLERMAFSLFSLGISTHSVPDELLCL